MSYNRPDFLTSEELERLIYHMPTVARRTSNKWASGFAKSIVRQSRRKGWSPSPKQLSIMRELVSDLFRGDGNEEGDELQVIE